MTCGATQAMRLGMRRVACVSTGNTSASMAAYASAAGLDPIVFIPHGNISYGKLAQALEYGARTLQVEANFDQILALVRVLAERLGIYLLNSINPFRIEGQKTISDRNAGSARLERAGLDRAARRQSGQCVGVWKGSARTARVRIHREDAAGWPWCRREGSAPFYDFVQSGRQSSSVTDPETLATAIKNRRSGFVAESAARDSASNGVVEKVTRAGDRRCQSRDRALRNRLRAGFGRHAGRHPQADGGRDCWTAMRTWWRC